MHIYLIIRIYLHLTFNSCSSGGSSGQVPDAGPQLPLIQVGDGEGPRCAGARVSSRGRQRPQRLREMVGEQGRRQQGDQVGVGRPWQGRRRGGYQVSRHGRAGSRRGKWGGWWQGKGVAGARGGG